MDPQNRRRSTSPMPPDQVQPTSSSTHIHAAGLHSRHHNHQQDQSSHTSTLARIQTTASTYIPGAAASGRRHSGEQTTSPTRLSFSLDHDGSRPNPTPRSVPKKRHASTSSATSAFSPTTSRKNTGSSSWSTKDNTKRLSGTVNHRGRHANDWLFGGFSLRDQVAKLWGRDKEGSSDEDEDEGRDVRGR